MENMKSGQGGWKGRTQKVMVVEDHTPHWRRRLVWSSDRLKTRKTVGHRPSFFVSILGIWVETSMSMDFVISKAAVKISSHISSWLAGSCASPLKGWASILPPWCCSHSAVKLVSMSLKTALGCALWTEGKGLVVYLSRALCVVNLLARVLFLLAATSRWFLVDRGIRIGGKMGWVGLGLFSLGGRVRGMGVAWGWGGMQGGLSWMGVRMS